MVKVILGSALGGLVAGGIALMAAGPMRSTTAEASMPAPGALPAMTATQSQPVTFAPMPAAQPAVRTAPVRERSVYREPSEPDVRRQPKRSVAKTAMIIGGSAGTGAGIGAIAGGKKGALIGAAIGGGAASIWEATKR
ncbi:MAG: hypothetical protein AB7Q16_07660 [Vicinamibacterales bacterium]